jgi:hypothetical protein
VIISDVIGGSFLSLRLLLGHWVNGLQHFEGTQCFILKGQEVKKHNALGMMGIIHLMAWHHIPEEQKPHSQ